MVKVNQSFGDARRHRWQNSMNPSNWKDHDRNIWSGDGRSTNITNSRFMGHNNVSYQNAIAPMWDVNDQIKLPQCMSNVINNVQMGNSVPKKVFIMRGVHGAGKSHLVNTFRNILRDAQLSSNASLSVIIVSSDDFFIQDDGSYKYDGARVGAAHSKCFGRFIAATKCAAADIIIVDNVNACLWEYANYLMLSHQCGYETHVIEMRAHDENMLKFFHSRNIHSVPLRACTSVMKRWEKDASAEVVNQCIPHNWQQQLHNSCNSAPNSAPVSPIVPSRQECKAPSNFDLNPKMTGTQGGVTTPPGIKSSNSSFPSKKCSWKPLTQTNKRNFVKDNRFQVGKVVSKNIPGGYSVFGGLSTVPQYGGNGVFSPPHPQKVHNVADIGLGMGHGVGPSLFNYPL